MIPRVYFRWSASRVGLESHPKYQVQVVDSAADLGRPNPDLQVNGALTRPDGVFPGQVLLSG